MTSHYEYFVTWYRLDGVDQYLIQYQNDIAGLLYDARGFIPSFGSEAELQQYAHSKGLEITPDNPQLHDFDAVDQWVTQDNEANPECNQLFIGLSLLLDISEAVGADFHRDRSHNGGPIFNKLYDCAHSRDNDIQWEKEELSQLRDTLRIGLQLFRLHVRANSGRGQH
jgi:hypothetical protein